MANAITLEFYKSGDTVMVDYNLQSMTLSAFCKLDEARKVLVKICKALMKVQPGLKKCKKPDCKLMEDSVVLPSDCDYIRIVGEYIRNHLLDHDQMLDIIVSGDTDRVSFHCEK